MPQEDPIKLEGGIIDRQNQTIEALTKSRASLMDTISALEARLKILEQRFSELGYTTQRLVQSEVKAAYTIDPQAETLYGLQLALCVSTIDPLKQNRVRFFHPALHRPDVPMKALPFAYPISAGFPSFDDSGITWVPPAGTMLCLMFQHGHKESPYYFGSIWNRDRGNPPTWAVPIEEWNIWAGTRGGYLIGKNDETQVFPPWNTWNYNGNDMDTVNEFETDPEAQRRITYPHIYGHKTPEKAYLRHNDGDRKCNLRWKSTILSSSRGNYILFKDDHLHPCGQEAHPKIGCGKGGGGDASACCNGDGTICEKPECCSCGDEDCPGGPTCPNSPTSSRCANPYFKREDEGRPYRGPATPLNPKAKLPQSGMHLQSISGHHMEFDDSVDQPTGKPTWDREFDFGCTNIFLGKCWWQSATGHKIIIKDIEDSAENRGKDNSIKIESACGSFIEINDHTIDKKYAGERRGVRIMSSSTHMLHMCDKDNQQASPIRRDGGSPIAKSKNAYVLLRSGYGLHLMMSDYHNQEKADKQFVQLLAPQKSNPKGVHVQHMQVVPTGPGVVLLRAGGYLWLSSTDHSVETVGEGKGRAHKFIDVTGMFLTNCDEMYINVNSLTLFRADKYIILGAGLDCPIPEDETQAQNLVNASLTQARSGNRVSIRDKLGPCIKPVIVARRPWVCPFTKFVHFGLESMSDRVFASATD